MSTDSIASWLESACKKNKPYGTSVITSANGTIPRIGFLQYIQRLQTYFDVSPCCYIAACVYIDRFILATGEEICSGNAHYLFCTALVLSCKYLEDFVYTNSRYAIIGGMGLSDLNIFELAFIHAIHFDFSISDETFARYHDTFNGGA
jgi:hypothetical protein